MTMILCQTEGCRICESIGGRPDPAKSRTASAPLDAASESCRPKRKKELENSVIPMQEFMQEAAPAPMPISSERDRADAQKYNSPDNKTIVKAKYIW